MITALAGAVHASAFSVPISKALTMASFITWLKNPFGSEDKKLDGWHLFLLIGLVFVFVAIWATIFTHIRENIE